MSDKNKLPDSVSGLDGSVSNEDLEKLNANKATEEKSKNPWDKEFDDNLNDEGQPSRVAKNKKRRGIKALVFGLFAALILIMFAPVMKWAIASNSEPNANNGNDQQVVTNDNKEKNTNAAKKKKAEQKAKLAKQKKEAAAKKAQLKEKKQIKEQELQNQKQKAAEEKLKADKQKEAAAAKAKQDQQNSQSQQNQQSQKAQQDQSSQTQNNQNSSGSGYYTVSAGENAYRIALNHNMTTEELYQLNGLQSGSTITPGMQLRVK